MNKKIVQAMIAAVTAAHMLGNVTTASAYSGVTDYPENQTTGLVVTAIDVRNSELTMHLRFANNHAAILRGVMFFEGDVEDRELLTARPGNDYAMKQYVRFDYTSEDWVDKETREDLVVRLDEDLAENTSHILGFTDYFLMSASSTANNINRGRVNYDRCASSEVFLNTEGAICRAEIWDDAVVHYQPYVGWNRLKMEDETEDKEVLVFKDSNWTELPKEESGDDGEGGSEGSGEGGSESSGEDNTEGSGGSEGGSDGDSEGGEGSGGSEGEGSGEGTGEGSGGSGETGSEGEDNGETKIVYVDREVPVEVIVEKEVIVEVPVEKEVIVEVPVEKEVIKEVIKEVPVETTVVKEVIKEVPVEKTKVETVEVQIPVEKTVVDVREVVKEVPVETTVASDTAISNAELWASMVAANTLGESEEELATEETEAIEEEIEPDDEEDALEPETSEKKPEVVDLPQLGKEEPKSSDLAGRIATFIAGLISATAMLMIVVAYRRKKQNLK